MSQVLIISGHPNLAQSSANQTILAALQQGLGEAAEIRRLDRLYADGNIDVAAEQAALRAAEVVVWQFPLHWYALPALMKKYLDEVYVYGFAHGSSGTALHGKKLLASFTAGAPGELYQTGKAMNFPMEAFLPPLQQSATLCGMEWQPPVYSTGMTYIPGVNSAEDLAAVQHKARAHAERVLAHIRSLI
ncbi:NAD(P)H-dependent oxidoreductase [Testudinibacter aquarius]|uniref:NAD(P)H-dependent oxidoreductase n=1 Tax=Testudinibacter aquarius TaxID=1524974 RepID=A0A4R3YBB3_9PAST|nr:NAD(P)H-dependent oxidoreductase [Testudinibacter aquarius]KAE9528977.1 NAD(P)H dehydrogenase [Testudinibacter aquarius]TCV89256.1 putative NADPH-quinone reductase [Testudinibacter aquarius]TNG93315.1 NAD(P)H-dependent oxidoreductase [Testudinibacter aquarius]